MSDHSKALKLRLYLAGQTPKSILALCNLKRICEDYVHENYELEIVDLLNNPKLSEEDDIFLIPTLVRKYPKPVKKIVGDMTNSEEVVARISLTRKAGHDR